MTLRSISLPFRRSFLRSIQPVLNVMKLATPQIILSAIIFTALIIIAPSAGAGRRHRPVYAATAAAQSVDLASAASSCRLLASPPWSMPYIWSSAVLKRAPSLKRSRKKVKSHVEELRPRRLVKLLTLITGWAYPLAMTSAGRSSPTRPRQRIARRWHRVGADRAGAADDKYFHARPAVGDQRA